MAATSTKTKNGKSDGAQPKPAAPAVNPLRAGLDSGRINDPCTIVFFGASGDLFKRMLMPAIYNLRVEDILPTNFSLIGFARSEYTDDEFRAYCKQAVDEL